jgi:hypothetical protein
MVMQIFGENACHPEPMRCAQGKLREGSGSMGAEILRFAQDDSPNPSPVRSREPYLQTSHGHEPFKVRILFQASFFDEGTDITRLLCYPGLEIIVFHDFPGELCLLASVLR